MTKEEMKAALKDELSQFKNDMASFATSEDMQNKLNDIEAKMKALDVTESLGELTKAVEKQGIELQKQFNDAPKKLKSVEDFLTENKDAILNATEKTVRFKTDVTRASVSDSAWAMDIPGFGQIAHLPTKLLGMFAQGTVSDGMGGVVRYVDQSSVTRAADWTAEAGVKPESEITWATLTMPLETIADTIPVTNQSLSDIPFLASEINNFLLTNLAVKIDKDLATGSGVAPIIFGIYTKASTFTAAASGITDANIYDLLKVMKTTITSGTQFMPNAVLINPDDADLMHLKKDTTNDYVKPPFVTFQGEDMYVWGMKIVETASITADTLVLGDFTKATVYTQGGVDIAIGLIDKQFVENMVTIRAEQRMGLLVRSVHEAAFIKSTGIAADLVTLAT